MLNCSVCPVEEVNAILAGDELAVKLKISSGA